jgi:alpha-glucoside transport system substrate-binding protein
VSRTTHLIRLLAVLAALALLAAGCLGGSESGTSGGGEGAAGGSSEDAAAGGGDDGGGGGGGEVEIAGNFSDAEADAFRAALQPFIDESGIDVTYTATPDFNTVITTRVEGGDLPDIALFPQPGLLLDVAEQIDAPPVSEYLDLAALEESLIPGFLDAVTTPEGEVMGFPMRMAVKSALWYPVPEFEEAGYELPETLEDLTALEDQIIADGGTPWCLGMESADATGWVGTDWVEEYMLRIHGPEVYDAWVSHELPFDSPEVREAFEAFEALWNKEGNVVGGSQGILGISFGDSPADLFTDPPGCFMHRQGNFITGFFPDDAQEDLDNQIGVTYFPPAGEGGYDGNPVLAGGDLALLMQDSEEARQVMEFLSTDTFGEPWAAEGGWLSPHVGFDASIYPTEVERSLAAIGAEADILRFDASDLMPGPVGAGSFWTGMVDWIGGQRSLDEVLTSIDESWPEDAGGSGGGGGATEEATEE